MAVKTAPPSDGCTSRDGSLRRHLSLNVIDAENVRAGRVRASRMGKRRAAVLIALNVLMIAHVIQWWISGRTASPIEPSETMYTLRDGAINAGFIFFSLALLSTLILGRWVCGWGCHIVALQDLCGWMMKKVGVRPRPFRSRVLMFVPLLAALYMFVYTPLEPRLFAPPPHNEFPGFSNHLMTEGFWDTFPDPWVAVPFLFLCGFAIVYFLGAKGYCTNACPYGGFFGLLDQFAPGRIRVTDDCAQCGHCTAVCTSNVKVHAEVRDYGMVVDPGCMKCMDCVSVCPNDALYFGWGRPKILAAKRTDKQSRTAWSLTGPEELLAVVAFAVGFFAWRSIYDVVPFLMALAVGGILSFCAVKLLHLARRRNVSIQNVELKSGDRLRPFGKIFVAATLVMLVLTAHSGYIRYHEFAGNRAYKRVNDFFYQHNMPEEVILDSTDLPRLRTAEFDEAVRRGLSHFSTCERRGLLGSADTRIKLGWLHFLDGAWDESSGSFRAARAMVRPKLRGTIDFYLGGVYARQGRIEEAIAAYSSAGEGGTYAFAALVKQGDLLAMLGRLPEAVEAWRRVVRIAPRFAPAHHNLGAALRRLNRVPEALAHYEAALSLMPHDPDTHFEVGEFLTDLGRPHDARPHYVEAAEHYRELAAQRPNDAMLHFRTGVALTRLGEEQAAAGYFAKAVELDPRYREFLENGE